MVAPGAARRPGAAIGGAGAGTGGRRPSSSSPNPNPSPLRSATLVAAAAIALGALLLPLPVPDDPLMSPKSYSPSNVPSLVAEYDQLRAAGATTAALRAALARHVVPLALGVPLPQQAEPAETAPKSSLSSSARGHPPSSSFSSTSSNLEAGIDAFARAAARELDRPRALARCPLWDGSLPRALRPPLRRSVKQEGTKMKTLSSRDLARREAEEMEEQEAAAAAASAGVGDVGGESATTPTRPPTFVLASNQYNSEAIMPNFIAQVLHLALGNEAVLNPRASQEEEDEDDEGDEGRRGNRTTRNRRRRRRSSSSTPPGHPLLSAPGQLRVSVYESGSRDSTPQWLELLELLLEAVGVPARVVAGGALRRGQGRGSSGGSSSSSNDRIAFLARVRNAALAPLARPPFSGEDVAEAEQAEAAAIARRVGGYSPLRRRRRLQATAAAAGLAAAGGGGGGEDAAAALDADQDREAEAARRRRRRRRGRGEDGDDSAVEGDYSDADDEGGAGGGGGKSGGKGGSGKGGSGKSSSSSSSSSKVRRDRDGKDHHDSDEEARDRPPLAPTTPWADGGNGGSNSGSGSGNSGSGTSGLQPPSSAAAPTSSSSSNPTPQTSTGWRPDYLAFANDVFFCAQDVARLASHRADAACGLDVWRVWGNVAWAREALAPPLEFYDFWVSRDADGRRFEPSPPHLPSRASADAQRKGLPFRAQCCWNGLVVLDAAPFLGGGGGGGEKGGALRFRARVLAPSFEGSALAALAAERGEDEDDDKGECREEKEARRREQEERDKEEEEEAAAAAAASSSSPSSSNPPKTPRPRPNPPTPKVSARERRRLERERTKRRKAAQRAASLPEAGECDASECSLLCDDLIRLGRRDVVVDPGVRVAYFWAVSRELAAGGGEMWMPTRWADVEATIDFDEDARGRVVSSSSGLARWWRRWRNGGLPHWRDMGPPGGPDRTECCPKVGPHVVPFNNCRMEPLAAEALLMPLPSAKGRGADAPTRAPAAAPAPDRGPAFVNYTAAAMDRWWKVTPGRNGAPPVRDCGLGLVEAAAEEEVEEKSKGGGAGSGGGGKAPSSSSSSSSPSAPLPPRPPSERQRP